ncbi:DUF2782 domain-containing protein [Nitrogeniibacter mangrovi]|uniref:DUF2782 domain-containing protein n=1 Tax=Nitrogeniibacter mangrovi TaxID=2016596 RepID=A0A6C1B0X1_9RHOO|nr:DUF2782 domain-containing protein [Nitrogeniibacter mangrovi]QID16639.1 DUF2782 domain-containing protein [Nitrogeniibacter mangrovi]
MPPVKTAALLAFLALLLPRVSLAQDPPPNLEAVPAPPPIPAGVSEEDFQPEVTIKKRGEETVEEFRVHGKLYMVKVTPAHGVPYYLVDRKGDGVFERETAEHKLSVPMWVIKSW